MCSHARENGGQCAYPERVVIRNGDVMLPALKACQANMAARLEIR